MRCAAVDERVEGADDVVAVDAEVEREVVARAGGDARVGQPHLGGDLGDDRLRAVAARHREPVGAALHGAADERLEVLAQLQLDRLDPALARLVGELEPLRLPAARLRVVEEHRPAGRRGVREVDVDLHRRPRRGQRDHEPDEDQQVGAACAVHDEQDHGAEQHDRADGQPQHAHDAPPQRAVPGGQAGDHDAAQEDQAAREHIHRVRDGEDERGRSHHERGERGESPAHRIAP